MNVGSHILICWVQFPSRVTARRRFVNPSPLVHESGILIHTVGDGSAIYNNFGRWTTPVVNRASHSRPIRARREGELPSLILVRPVPGRVEPSVHTSRRRRAGRTQQEASHWTGSVGAERDVERTGGVSNEGVETPSIGDESRGPGASRTAIERDRRESAVAATGRPSPVTTSATSAPRGAPSRRRRARPRARRRSPRGGRASAAR